MLFEIKGTRPELAVKALEVRVPFLLLISLRTRVIAKEGNLDERIVLSRVLPYFKKEAVVIRMSKGKGRS